MGTGCKKFALAEPLACRVSNPAALSPISARTPRMS